MFICFLFFFFLTTSSRGIRRSLSGTIPRWGRGSARRSGFPIIGIGTAFHTFHLHGHRWLEPGTTSVIDTINIGPISRQAFVVQAGEGVGPGDWPEKGRADRGQECLRPTALVESGNG